MIRNVAMVVAAAWLGVAALTVERVAAQEDGTVRVVLEVTDVGYRCTSGCDVVDFSRGDWAPSVDVALGAMVELTFVWAHEAYPNEEHVMVLEGYGLESDQIDREHRETTLRFIADQPGAFKFKCDLHCELHDFMQRADVRVRRSGSGTVDALTYTPTVLELRAAAPVISGREPVELTATLRDQEGQPIDRAELTFFVEATFGGVEDLVRVATEKTDADGAASFWFRPLTPEPEQRIVVRFAGMGLYDQSEQYIELIVTGAAPPAYTSHTTGFETLRDRAGVGAVAVFAVVWATLGFVMFQAMRIRSVGGDG
ncbi:MAG: hypothetical protein Kow0010_16710 [Dehalococcoidia bacterium]